jgi:phospholipase C
MTPEQLKNHVDTIVVLIMENRSFDSVLGYLSHPAAGNRPEVRGITSLDDDDLININSAGVGIRPFWRADAPFASDLPHDADAVQQQLAYSPLIKTHLMNGFVKAYENEFHSQVNDPPVMGLLQAKDLPTTSVLADSYTVCDHWFSCVPTSTAPNRLMSMCGATGLRETNILLPDQPTVYDWLLDHGIRWRVYAAGLPFFALMPRMAPLILTGHFRHLSDLEHDVLNESPDDWPQVIFIEPDYYDCPVHFQPSCDNHAPLAMAPGETFVAEAYRWLTASKQKWERSVFAFTYDEHGGFFDHVPPLPIRYSHPNGVAFQTTGPRIPAIVAGPYAPARGVCHLPLDNTSILQLIAERFGEPGESYSPEVLGRANQGIASMSGVLDASAANTRVCTFRQAAASTPAGVANSSIRRGFDTSIKALVDRHRTEALTKYPGLRV